MRYRFTPLSWTLLALAGIWLFSFAYFDRWHEEFRGGDPWGYYAHLPAAFIHHDVGDYSKTFAASESIWPGGNLNAGDTPIGKRCNKYPLGVALLLLPFFLLAHGFTLLTGWFPANGFTPPYALAVGLAPIAYVLLGMRALAGVLRRYFSVEITVLTLLTLGLATNLFYFTAYNNLMSHAFLFAIFCWLLWAMHRFEEKPELRRALAVGALFGLLTATRLHAVMLLLAPLLWGVHSAASLKQRVLFLKREYRLLLAAGVAFALLLAPQLAYYKYVSGQWLYYAYQGETFNFAHPRILDGLFSYSNGWLVYTPVMILALIGLFRLPKTVPAAVGPLYSLLPVYVYVTYSWWCWNYINGFGSRPMVDIYPLLALPLGAFLSWGAHKTWKKSLNLLLFAGFACLNLFQTWQLAEGLIWTEAGNRAHFWTMFGRTASSKEALIAYESNEMQPLGEQPVFVKNLLQNPMEDPALPGAVTDLKHSGNYSVKATEEFTGTMVTPPLEDVQPGDWIRASVWGHMRRGEHQIARDQQALLVLEFRTPEWQELKNRGFKISSKIGNPTYSIWSTGEPDQWGEAAFFVKTPPNFSKGCQIKAYIWNPARQNLYLDDLRVDLYR